MGGDSSMNELFVQGNINSLADLRGKIVIVDAPNTAYALQAKKILKNAGLKESDYVVKPIGGTMLRLKEEPPEPLFSKFMNGVMGKLKTPAPGVAA